MNIRATEIPADRAIISISPRCIENAPRLGLGIFRFEELTYNVIELQEVLRLLLTISNVSA